jgi:hypothetical protein
MRRRRVRERGRWGERASEGEGDGAGEGERKTERAREGDGDAAGEGETETETGSAGRAVDRAQLVGLCSRKPRQDSLWGAQAGQLAIERRSAVGWFRRPAVVLSPDVTLSPRCQCHGGDCGCETLRGRCAAAGLAKAKVCRGWHHDPIFIFHEKNILCHFQIKQQIDSDQDVSRPARLLRCLCSTHCSAVLAR